MRIHHVGLLCLVMLEYENKCLVPALKSNANQRRIKLRDKYTDYRKSYHYLTAMHEV